MKKVVVNVRDSLIAISLASFPFYHSAGLVACMQVVVKMLQVCVLYFMMWKFFTLLLSFLLFCLIALKVLPTKTGASNTRIDMRKKEKVRKDGKNISSHHARLSTAMPSSL
jgi:hypothetical protein